LDPNRSSRSPPGIWNATYAQPNAENTYPIATALMPSCFAAAGPAIERVDRSPKLRHVTKNSTVRIA
jgi:hypothetical protein